METETLDVAGKKLSLVEAFADLPDPRVVGRSKHDLMEMLVVAVCALVCGVDDFVGIQLWAEERGDWLRTFLKLENGIPSHDTFGRLFGLLDQAAVEKGFRRWVGSVLPALAEGSVVAVDGKASRRSRRAGQQALYLVSAFATQARLVLGQEACAEKSNEQTAIPVLLEALMLKGRDRHHRRHGNAQQHCPVDSRQGSRLRAGGERQSTQVRTLREKITLMATSGDQAAWMRELATTWMESDPTEAGYLYIDCHVRVYHGDQAVLPRRYVSRERLCLRGTTDYWINDALGRPFFVVSKAITSGLGDTLLKDIVPQLLESVPGQPAPEQLAEDPRLHRFVLVFDREGATAVLLEALWQQRIGAITYRKNVKDVWPESEFAHTDVALPDGVQLSMKLAMRETRLGETLTVKEVRRLTPTGHQTAVISTAHTLDSVMIVGRMFARWCQENFFAYMMQHNDIDGLVQYGA